MSRLVVHRATIDGALVDVSIEGERVVAVVPTVARQRGPDVIDAGGGALLPGLHDHHLHLLAMAAARTSVRAGPPEVVDAGGLATALRQADAARPPGSWIRAVGYHESVAGELDAAALDALAPAGRPVRVQHRSGACWYLNSAAMIAVGAPSDRLYGRDGWLGERVPREPVDLAAVGDELASYGITAVTDATPSERADDVAPLAAAARSGLAVRVTITGGPALAAGVAADLARGPVKLVVADHSLPSVDELVASMRLARRAGRAVAVHCVTRVGLVLALAAWDEVGVVAGDRIEHGAVVPAELVADLATRGLTVVTQPAFVAARGDAYLAEVDGRDRPDLWRCASLLAAGVRVGGSSDAPFGLADPWVAMRAAVERATSAGALLGPHEAITARAALGLYLAPLDDPGGPARRIAPGVRADLCLLDRPLDEALREFDARHVALTVAAGRVTHRR